MIFKSTYKKRKYASGFLTGIVVGGIVFGGIGVAAITLTADQVKYTPSNENFNVTNVEEALNEVYKISEYKIPEDTYFYDSDTKGENVVRYKKVDGKYYLCNENGKVEDNALEVDVSEKSLVEYNSLSAKNIMLGSAGYANEFLYLGNGSDSASGTLTLSARATVYLYHSGYNANYCYTTSNLSFQINIVDGVISGITCNSSKLVTDKVATVAGVIEPYTVTDYNWTAN